MVQSTTQLSSQPATQSPPPINDKLTSREFRGMVAILLSIALATLDTAIANTALPAIAADLKASPAASVWIINA